MGQIKFFSDSILFLNFLELCPSALDIFTKYSKWLSHKNSSLDGFSLSVTLQSQNQKVLWVLAWNQVLTSSPEIAIGVRVRCNNVGNEAAHRGVLLQHQGLHLQHPGDGDYEHAGYVWSVCWTFYFKQRRKTTKPTWEACCWHQQSRC